MIKLKGRGVAKVKRHFLWEAWLFVAVGRRAVDFKVLGILGCCGPAAAAGGLCAVGEGGVPRPPDLWQIQEDIEGE